ncbi:MAG: hypothetical protein H7287_02385, partial [Thermoleophilia bacterium]|nr:hypothetical protein [Thermoleophilia bacterium]
MLNRFTHVRHQLRGLMVAHRVMLLAVVAMLAIAVPFAMAQGAASSRKSKVVLAKRNSVNAASVINGSLTGADIKNSTIGSIDIKNGSLPGPDLKAGTITGTQIAAGTITSANIKAGSTTTAQLAPQTLDTLRSTGLTGAAGLAEASITTPLIANGSINATKLAANSVTSA